MGGAAVTAVVTVALLLLIGHMTTLRAARTLVAPMAPSPEIGQFAIAIATAEGFGDPGAIPTRANNPGDLELGGTTLGEGVTVYPTVEDGWNALYHQLLLVRDGRSHVYRTDMTLTEFGATWSGGDPNWTVNVARVLATSTDAIVGPLLGAL